MATSGKNIWGTSTGLFGTKSPEGDKKDEGPVGPKLGMSFVDVARRNSQEAKERHLGEQAVVPHQHDNKIKQMPRSRHETQYCAEAGNADGPSNNSSHSMFASIGGLESHMYSDRSASINNNESRKCHAQPSSAFGFDELINPRPAHLVPLEAHNLSSLDSLTFGMNDEASNMYYKSPSLTQSRVASSNRYVAQRLHDTHTSGWQQHGTRKHHAQDNDNNSVSFGGSVLNYNDNGPGRGSSTGTNSISEKRSSSESNRGSDEGLPNGNTSSLHREITNNSQMQFSNNSTNGYKNGYYGQNSRTSNEGKNRGYRKYWNQVTNVNKGSRQSNQRSHNLNGKQGDTSVEGLLEVILALPPEMSTIPAVASGLHSLDAGALAALLKELNKNRASHRAQEIFDWLRKLDTNHPLSSLCTTMTYTTMISQCGVQHALRRAMELMAEMKSRNIGCNVHTYSALMNVCIKAGELDVALEVYDEMLNEGCTPNLVTYNTLIDVYGKTGQWEEAIGVLDDVERRGLEPEARTYNTAIIACNQSSRAQEALQIYQRMLQANAKPTATTYTALISAYGKAGQLEQALEIFNSMESNNCEKNVITYSSLISACEKAGEWQLALKLFNDMHTKGCQPNVVTYNSLIAACAQGAQAEKAQQIFDLMQGRGCRPDSVTFGALITAYDRAGDWRSALSSFDVVRSLGCRPDTVVYNTIIGCLWRTGLVKSQECAMQIFHTACKQGHFRTSISSDSLPKGNSGHLNTRASGIMDPPIAFAGDAVLATTGDIHLPRIEYAMHAFTVGSALLCMYRWLTEVRSRGMSQAGQAPEITILTLNKGKPSRDHRYPLIKEALVAKLRAWKAPLDLVDTSIGCQIFGKSQDVIRWLETGAVRQQLDSFLVCSNPAISTADQLYQEDAITESRCKEAFSAVKQLESMNAVMLGAQANQSPIHDQHELFLEMASFAKSGCCPEDILYDGFDILMRAIEFGQDSILSNSNHVLVSACYYYAASLSMGEHRAMDAIGMTLQHDRQEIIGLSQQIKTAFNRNLSSISPNRVLKLYLERLGACFEGRPPINDPVAGVSFALLPMCVSSVSMHRYTSSVLAAALLTVGRMNAGISPFWPRCLEQMTGYSLEDGTDLSSAVSSVSALPAGGAFEL
jgi:pentatricopeptide repeat domain-containing protein 1